MNRFKVFHVFDDKNKLLLNWIKLFVNLLFYQRFIELIKIKDKKMTVYLLFSRKKIRYKTALDEESSINKKYELFHWLFMK